MRKFNHEQIKRDCAKGLKLAHVAAKHGCSVSLVSYLATTSGDWRREPKQLSENQLKAVQMYCKGEPLKLINLETGYSDSLIYQIIKKVGVMPRRNRRVKVQQRSNAAAN